MEVEVVRTNLVGVGDSFLYHSHTNEQPGTWTTTMNEAQREEEGVAEIFIISIRPSTATSLKLADFIHWSS